MLYHQEANEKQLMQKYRLAEGCYYSNLGFNITAVILILIVSMLHCIYAATYEGASTTYILVPNVSF